MPTQTLPETSSRTGRVAVENILQNLQLQGHSVNWLADRIGTNTEALFNELLFDDTLTVWTLTRTAKALAVPFESLLTERNR